MIFYKYFCACFISGVKSKYISDPLKEKSNDMFFSAPEEHKMQNVNSRLYQYRNQTINRTELQMPAFSAMYSGLLPSMQSTGLPTQPPAGKERKGPFPMVKAFFESAP